MKVSQSGLWLAISLLLAVHPAVANTVELGVDCPAEAAAGSSITADLHFRNQNCTSGYNVRVISSIAGNADQSLGGIGIGGPVVVDSSIAVPAGTPPFPGGPCLATVDLTLPTPPAIPASLEGTVATFVLISEWDQLQFGVPGIDATEVAQCMVNITPP